MRRTLQRATAGVTAVCVTLLASCSGKGERLPETGATLEGTVTYRGQKLSFAAIFVKGPDAMAQGKVGEDGRYKVENVPLGEVEIGVNTSASKGDYMSLSMAQSYKGPEGKGKARASLPRFIDVPERYADPETSGIKTTVQKGDNTYDIVMPR